MCSLVNLPTKSVVCVGVEGPSADSATWVIPARNDNRRDVLLGEKAASPFHQLESSRVFLQFLAIDIAGRSLKRLRSKFFQLSFRKSFEKRLVDGERFGHGWRGPQQNDLPCQLAPVSVEFALVRKSTHCHQFARDGSRCGW